jgi:DNA-binding NarL/FixJ family response regulator
MLTRLRPTPPAAPLVQPPTTTVRVLIVDDHPAFASLLSAALEHVDGLECVGTASSADEGLRRVAELHPSVVVMDIMMPGVDGLTATRELREVSPGTAVAVVSAHREGDWIARAESAGASAYIPKGGSLQEMIETLQAARPGAMIVAPSLQAQVAASAAAAAAVAETPPQPPVAPAGRVTTAAAHGVGACRGYLRSLSDALHLGHPAK